MFGDIGNVQYASLETKCSRASSAYALSQIFLNC
jgi:hypothetical protein